MSTEVDENPIPEENLTAEAYEDQECEQSGEGDENPAEPESPAASAAAKPQAKDKKKRKDVPVTRTGKAPPIAKKSKKSVPNPDPDVRKPGVRKPVHGGGMVKGAKKAHQVVVGKLPNKVTLDKDDSERFYVMASALKMVADKTRLKIVSMLAEKSYYVGEMCMEIVASQPAVSHHLALLRHSGMVEPTRDGKTVNYALTEKGRVLWDVIHSYK